MEIDDQQPFDDPDNNLNIDAAQLQLQKALKKKAIRKRLFWWFVILIGSIVLFTIFIILIVSYFKSRKNQNPEQIPDNDIGFKTLKTLILDASSDLYDENTLIDPILARQVQHLILRDQRITFFNTSLFTNLVKIEIDSKLKLQKLIINNSKLTEFAYNSTALLQLQFCNNSMMTKFENSDLPNLVNLKISSSNITNWTNNKFQSLSYLSLSDSWLNIIDSNQFLGLKQLIVENCRVEYISRISDLKQILTIKFTSVILLQSLFISNLDLQLFSFINCTVKISLDIHYCPHLKSIEIDCDQLRFLGIFNNGNIENLSIVIKKIYQVQFKNSSIQQLKIEIQSSNKLQLKDLFVQKMSNNRILGLKHIILSNVSFDQVQFSKVALSQLNSLQLGSVNSTLLLNNSFPFLEYAQFYNLSETSLTSFIAPKLYNMVIERCNFSIDGLQIKGVNNLNWLNISDVQTSKINIDSQVKKIRLYGLNQKTQSKADFFLKSSITQYLNISSVFIKSFENLNLPTLKSLYITKSYLGEFKNNVFNQNLQKISIEYHNIITTFSNNSFNVVQETNLKFYSNTISIWNQSLPNKVVDLRHNELLSTFGIDSLFPVVQKLVLSFNKFSQFNNLSFPSLKQLQLVWCGNLRQFQNNYLPNLTTLKIATLKIPENEILQQFQKLKNKGTELRHLQIYPDRRQFRAQIKQIFSQVVFI